jgi:hypothetical protein
VGARRDVAVTPLPLPTLARVPAERAPSSDFSSLGRATTPPVAYRAKKLYSTSMAAEKLHCLVSTECSMALSRREKSLRKSAIAASSVHAPSSISSSARRAVFCSVMSAVRTSDQLAASAGSMDSFALVKSRTLICKRAMSRS